MGCMMQLRERHKIEPTKWIVTEKNEGRKSCKVRLGARGFEESDEEMRDEPTFLEKTLKLF